MKPNILKLLFILKLAATQ